MKKKEREKKWWGLAKPLYSLQVKGRQSPGWKPKGDKLAYMEDSPGSWYHQSLGEQEELREHSRYIHVQLE